MSRSPFLTAEWRALVMLSYEIQPEVLRDLAPRGTDLDSRCGRFFVSLIGLHFLDAKVLGFPVPFHRSFEQVNLRFYVRREAADEVRRGVAFVKQIGPRPMIAWTARQLYQENYVSVPMRHQDRLPVAPAYSAEEVGYGWRHENDWCGLSVSVSGAPALADLESEEAFIAERYWGYSRRADGSTLEYRVEHPRWEIWRARDVELRCDIASLYGKPFESALSGAPSTAFVARGSAVAVYSGRPI